MSDKKDVKKPMILDGGYNPNRVTQNSVPVEKGYNPNRTIDNSRPNIVTEGYNPNRVIDMNNQKSSPTVPAGSTYTTSANNKSSKKSD